MLASGPGCRRWPQLSPGRGPSHQGQPLVQALGPTLVPRGRPAWRTPAPAWSRSLGGGEPCPRLVHAGPPLTEPTRGGEGLLGLSCLLGRCSCHSAHVPRAGAPTRPVLSVFAAQRGDSAEEVTSRRPVPSRARWRTRQIFLFRVQGRHYQSHAASPRADERYPRDGHRPGRRWVGPSLPRRPGASCQLGSLCLARARSPLGRHTTSLRLQRTMCVQSHSTCGCAEAGTGAHENLSGLLFPWLPEVEACPWSPRHGHQWEQRWTLPTGSVQWQPAWGAWAGELHQGLLGEGQE